VGAVRTDFSQYGPQKLLFLELFKLILGKDTPVKKDPAGEGVWIAAPPGKRMKFLNFHEMGDYLIAALKSRPPPMELLAAICQRVFRTRVYPGHDESGKPAGIWVETGMEDFNCRQCGRCCQTLKYHDGCTVENYRNLERLGRTDIMEWVNPISQDGEIVSCRIWVKPGTHDYAEVCPWLRKIPDQNRYECRIHDVRPEICRQYPGTRKHAEMTGCVGFRMS
jgi:Fe-S-cluster containining protein